LHRDPPLGSKLDGIRQQVEQDLLDPERIAEHARGIRLERADEAHLDVLLLSDGSDRVERAFDDVAEVERNTLERDGMALETRMVENVVDQTKKVFSARDDGTEVFTLDLRETGTSLENSSKALNVRA
jgi:hypothetical protein